MRVPRRLLLRVSYRNELMPAQLFVENESLLLECHRLVNEYDDEQRLMLRRLLLNYVMSRNDVHYYFVFCL